MEKRQTPKRPKREDVDTLTDHERYVAARARRTELQVEAESIKLAITRRNLIARAECEREFARVGAVMKALMRRIQNDLPCCLVGLESSEIDRVIGEKFAAAMNSFALSPGFLEPSGKAAK